MSLEVFLLAVYLFFVFTLHFSQVGVSLAKYLRLLSGFMKDPGWDDESKCLPLSGCSCRRSSPCSWLLGSRCGRQRAPALKRPSTPQLPKLWRRVSFPGQRPAPQKWTSTATQVRQLRRESVKNDIKPPFYVHFCHWLADTVEIHTCSFNDLWNLMLDE